jgi:xanthosine utilization system XapX-like protein
MYGTWFNITAGVAVGIVALVIALVVAASPLLAVVIALVIGLLAMGAAAMRRSGQYLERSEGEQQPSPRQRREMASTDIGPEPRGAPASGEGERAGTLPPNPGAPSREVGA